MDFLKKSITEIYRRYYSDVYYYCYHSLCKGNQEEAAELTQSTFCKAIEKIDSYRGDGDIRYWLRTIARNEYITTRRKNRRLSLESDMDLKMEQLPDERENVAQTVENREILGRVSEILREMDFPYADVFRLRVLQDADFAKIAALFGKTESWARVTFYRVKQKIIQK